jgi:hypothetical protein
MVQIAPMQAQLSGGGRPITGMASHGRLDLALPELVHPLGERTSAAANLGFR